MDGLTRTQEKVLEMVENGFWATGGDWGYKEIGMVLSIDLHPQNIDKPIVVGRMAVNSELSDWYDEAEVLIDHVTQRVYTDWSDNAASMTQLTVALHRYSEGMLDWTEAVDIDVTDGLWKVLDFRIVSIFGGA